MIKRIAASMSAVFSLALLSACANINTIDRTNTFDSKLIHLDVQQRLLIINEAKKYCAEPSPDAMAAYAASLGFGASAAAKGAVSANGAGQNTAASIGLRTQSITLMRDALYRMCEAYANGAVGDAQVVTLLNRSQDLTAVVLAVEQLTGAVAANQAALFGSSNSNSFASALNNSKLLAEATAHTERTSKRLEEAMAEHSAAEKKLAAVNAELESVKNVQKDLEEAEEPDDKKIQDAKREVAFRESLRGAAELKEKSAAERMTLRQTAYDDAVKVMEEIAKTPDSATASGSAGTTGQSEYSTPTPRVALSADATVALATAVKDIVQTVLQKDYVLDSCMSVVTSSLSTDFVIWARQVETQKYCQELVKAVLLEKTVQAEARLSAAKTSMTRRVVSDAERIINCIAPAGSLVAARRNQLFLDANKDGSLSGLASTVSGASDANDFRTMLAQNPNVRRAMAAAVDSSAVCN